MTRLLLRPPSDTASGATVDANEAVPRATMTVCQLSGDHWSSPNCASMAPACVLVADDLLASDHGFDPAPVAKIAMVNGSAETT
jgi:hypothetical protein